jgi:ABC-type glycerol-3-phosphate transport system permease component
MSVIRLATVTPRDRRVRAARSLAGVALHRATIAFLLLWSLLPIVWLLVMSTQPELNYRSAPLQLDPADVSLEWFGIMLSKPEFISAAVNSVVIAGITMVVTVALGALAAYPCAGRASSWRSSSRAAWCPR